MGNTFASSFLSLLSDPRKMSDYLKFSGFPLSKNIKISHIEAKMQDRPFPVYAGRQSNLSLLFFKSCETSGKFYHVDEVLITCTFLLSNRSS